MYSTFLQLCVAASHAVRRFDVHAIPLQPNPNRTNKNQKNQTEKKFVPRRVLAAPVKIDPK